MRRTVPPLRRPALPESVPPPGRKESRRFRPCSNEPPLCSQRPPHCIDGYHSVLVYKRDLSATRIEHVLDTFPEQPGYSERQRQAWVVLLGLDRVHGLARDRQSL